MAGPRERDGVQEIVDGAVSRSAGRAARPRSWRRPGPGHRRGRPGTGQMR